MSEYFEIICLVVLAFILAKVIDFLCSLVLLLIRIVKENRTIINGLKMKLKVGEITEEEYNKQIKSFIEGCKRGDYDKN